MYLSILLISYWPQAHGSLHYVVCSLYLRQYVTQSCNTRLWPTTARADKLINYKLQVAITSKVQNEVRAIIYNCTDILNSMKYV